MTPQLVTPSATDQLWDRWPYLSHKERLTQFRELHTGEKANVFLALSAHDQCFLLLGLPRFTLLLLPAPERMRLVRKLLKVAPITGSAD